MSAKQKENQLYQSIIYNEAGEIRPKHDQLQNFLKHFEYLPEQGSKAWLAAKHGSAIKPPTIGGSEISTLLGENHYQTTRDLYETKLGVSEFRGNSFTQWGNLCEPVIQQYCDLITDSTTYETGSIPGLEDESGNVIQTYSPDGLNVMQKSVYLGLCEKWLLEHAGDSNPQTVNEVKLAIEKCREIEGDWVLNLMEFKCPAIRFPSGQIPPQYKSQPKIGAATLQMVDTILFVDAVIRLCSIRNLLEIKDSYIHNKEINGKYNKLGQSRKPKAVGFVGVFHKHSKENSKEKPKMQDCHIPKTDCAAKFVRELCEKNIRNPDIRSEKDLMNILPPDEFLKLCDKLGGRESTREIFSMSAELAVQSAENRLKFLTSLTDNVSDKKFCETMDKIISNRFDSTDYQTWYSKLFLIPDETDNETANQKLKTFMLKELNWFMNFGRCNNIELVGIIPMEILHVEIVPAAKDPEFRNRHEEKIIDVVKDIEKIKILVAGEKDQEIRKKIIAEELSKRFDSSRSAKPQIQPEKIEIDTADEMDWADFMV